MEDILEQMGQQRPCLPCPRPDPPCGCRSEDWGTGPTSFSQAAYDCLLGSGCAHRPKPCSAEKADPDETDVTQ